MTKLREEIESTLLPGMIIPHPLDLLFSWIESKGLITETKDGRSIGFLFSEDEIEEEETDTERPGGTFIEFFAQGNINLKYWFGHDKPDVLNRLCVFAKTGGDGSMAAFWLDDNGKQKIVHMGSGSGSTLVCVLADDPVDFLRLIAIGYEEICREDQFANPPNADCSEDDPYIHPNVEFQNWVEKTFSVTIPQTAMEIVQYPSKIGDTDSDDPFWQWVDQNI
jgi:hypothetical protein